MSVVYNRLERPLIQVLSAMEEHGIVVDANILRRLSNEFANKIIQLEKEIYILANQNFNIASPKQLGEILFEKLQLEGGKKSKTGAWTTSADILEEMASKVIRVWLKGEDNPGGCTFKESKRKRCCEGSRSAMWTSSPHCGMDVRKP